MDNQNTKILIVDDDPRLRELLNRYLGEQGFLTHAVADGVAMARYLAKSSVDLIILDLMLPGDDGLTLARRLRSSSNTPIIILSARGDDVDRIVGLEVGADDYLAKPFNPRELLARIRAVLRRNCPNKPTDSDSRIRTFGPFQLNLNNHTLLRGDEDILLTAGELALIEIFTEYPNRTLSRDHLVDLLKGYERSPFDRSVDVRVTRLRRKIEQDPKAPQFIRTVWGKGYLFTPQGAAHQD
ncbi:MAG: response regulator [Candidatus Polarisedimenticolaceae bacterium]|nr:response regulator [Candidatus Polarisedimenticolaceae bacterium]